MGFTQPDTPPPPQGVPQEHAVQGPGPAAAPYTGPDRGPEPPVYSAPPVGDAGGAFGMVMDGYAPGNAVAGGTLSIADAVIAAYAPGAPQPVAGPGDQDIIAAAVGAAMEASHRYHTGAAVTIGYQPDLPAAGNEQSKHAGGTDAGYPS